jgi:hypothetical protein
MLERFLRFSINITFCAAVGDIAPAFRKGDFEYAGEILHDFFFKVERVEFPEGTLYYSKDTHYSVAKIVKLLRIKSQLVESQPSSQIATKHITFCAAVGDIAPAFRKGDFEYAGEIQAGAMSPTAAQKVICLVAIWEENCSRKARSTIQKIPMPILAKMMGWRSPEVLILLIKSS